MPPLHGFTDNPLRTRDDLVRAAKALVKPLEHYRSPHGARVKILPATVAGFDDVAAQLEGFARPLFTVGAFLHQKSEANDEGSQLRNWVRGLEAGVDPSSPDFWGHLGDVDQRMVEMESISITLLIAPDEVLGYLSKTGRQNLIAWLSEINNRRMPPNNWRWFRVFVNLALTRVLGVPRSSVIEHVESDFAILDSFYMGDGWSSDGPWGEERKQADYYSGSFAIQFAQLLYVRFAVDDEQRVAKYRQQAQEFAQSYWRYFDINGAAIPFGRSMIYRFAFAAFWAAAALIDVELPAPVNNPGVVKGLILRHLRWWSKHEDIFTYDGLLNLGFTYPNMYLTEDYNSPQSVFWCLKTFIVLVLPKDHSFWSCEELPHPLSSQSSLEKARVVELLKHPRHLICNASEHHYLLSSGQGTLKPHKAKEAKYGKFAYSSAFGFSVPSGPLLTQMAPDSTLCVSINGGEAWQVRRNPVDVKALTVEIDGGETKAVYQALASVWKPLSWLDLRVETTLVPLAETHPGWHLRMHRIVWSPSPILSAISKTMEFVDGGFAISSVSQEGHHIPSIQQGAVEHGSCVTPTSAIIRSQAGASGILDMSGNFSSFSPYTTQAKGTTAKATTEASMLRADPNTNLISSKTCIPIIKHNIASPYLDGSSTDSGNGSFESWLVVAVFAVSTANGPRDDISELWMRSPTIQSLQSVSNELDM